MTLDSRAKAAKQAKTVRVSTADVERIIGKVNGTMAIEGMPLTDEDKERLRTILHGEVSAEEMVAQLVAKHKRTPKPAHGITIGSETKKLCVSICRKCQLIHLADEYCLSVETIRKIIFK